VAAPSGPVHAEADRMTYVSAEHRAHLEQNAKVRTDQGTVRSSVIDLFFVPEGPKTPAATAPPSPSPLTGLGGQSLEHATALGNVVIDDGDRHAKAGRADYTAADGKFVLSGDHPTVYDGSGNATNGRQLTFVFADDTIVVDSEEGSRTLTLHRVEK
jgi:lipopolysaccharide export system protein LptA